MYKTEYGKHAPFVRSCQASLSNQGTVWPEAQRLLALLAREHVAAAREQVAATC